MLALTYARTQTDKQTDRQIETQTQTHVYIYICTFTHKCACVYTYICVTKMLQPGVSKDCCSDTKHVFMHVYIMHILWDA